RSASRAVPYRWGEARPELAPWFGPRPLIEDDSVRSGASSLVSAQAGYASTPKLQARVEVYNLLDAKESDIDYFYTSRLCPDAEPRDDVHFHPAKPRTVRLV